MKKYFILTGLILFQLGAAGSNWIYSAFPDKMTDREARVAVLRSDNSLDLPFPDHGDNRAILVVRQDPNDGLIVYLKAKRGRIICGGSKACDIRLRFDSASPVRFKASPSMDSNIIFLTDGKKFINSAKISKKLLVEVTFLLGGDQVLEFSPSISLVWPIPDPREMNELVRKKLDTKKPVAFDDESVSGTGDFCGKYAIQEQGVQNLSYKKFIVFKGEFLDIEDGVFEALGSEHWKTLVELQKQVVRVKAKEGIDPKKANLLLFRSRWDSICQIRYGGP